MNVLLNCDLGEGESEELTLALLDVIDLANIACGGHAGNEATMRRVVREATARRVQTGAHPGWPDRENFGRAAEGVTPRRLTEVLREQVGLFQRMVTEEGGTLGHVKLHGVLYHLCNESTELAEACVDFMDSEFEGCPLVCGAGSLLQALGEARGTPLLREIFADRGYEAEARLVPRGSARDVLDDPVRAAERILDWTHTGFLTLADGRRWLVEAETVCVHADSPGAATLATAVRDVLGPGQT
jgi:5-oxoprolinase (ATP-hydrolysing) subunit A